MNPQWNTSLLLRPLACLILMFTANITSADCQYYQQITHGPWRAIIDASAENGCSLQTIYLALGTRERKLGDHTLTTSDPVSDAWLTDLDGNQSPELILITTSAGSGSYAGLRLFTLNEKTLQGFELPSLKQALISEYRGHDKYLLHDNLIIREYPIYRKRDPNCCPTGGLRRQFYRFNGDGLILEP
jgi:hypothetical protein